MKMLFFALLLFVSNHLKAQTNADYLKEINRDIWLPFIEAYGTCDIDKYKSLHNEAFIRASSNGKDLPTYQEYFENSGKWFAEIKSEGRKLAIAFRFTERFANGKVASERGIYQLKSFNKEGKEVWTGYGKFHVFLRKIDGMWKIVVDYDSDENKTINEASFNAAFALDDFEKY